MNPQDPATQSNEIHDEVRPLFVNIKKVAQICDIDPRTVYRRVKAGDMPAPIKFGGRTLWRWRELELWCEAGCPSVGESKGADH